MSLVCSYFWPCDCTFPPLPSSDKTGAVYPPEPFCFAKFKTRLVSQFPRFCFFLISHQVLFTSPCMRASKVGEAGRAAGDVSVTSTQPRTDGAAGSVWQITLLVVGLNPVPTAVSPSTTQTLSHVTVMCARTCHHTQRERELPLRAKRRASSAGASGVIYIPGFLSDLRKHQKPISRQKPLNITCFA